jgi:hypothetical protein
MVPMVSVPGPPLVGSTMVVEPVEPVTPVFDPLVVVGSLVSVDGAVLELSVPLEPDSLAELLDELADSSGLQAGAARAAQSSTEGVDRLTLNRMGRWLRGPARTINRKSGDANSNPARRAVRPDPRGWAGARAGAARAGLLLICP